MKEDDIILLVIVGIVGYWVYITYLKKPVEPGKVAAQFVETGVS